MLQVNFDERGSSYIDNFVPFVAQCVKDTSTEEVSATEIQRQVRERFGLVIPQHALQTILKSGARRGLYSIRNQTLVKNSESLNGFNIEPTRQRALRAYAELLDKFIRFAREFHHLELSEGEIDDAFLGYLTDRAIPIVRTTLLGEAFQPHLARTDAIEYLIAAFIIHLSEADVQGFDSLDMIVRGCMLATAIYLPDPNDRARKVSDLAIYVDTPVVVNLLGLQGVALAKAAEELVSLLIALNIRVLCFTHTLDEVQNLITACAQQLSSPAPSGRRQNEIISYALSRGVGRTQLELKAQQVEANLSSGNITVRDAPDYTVRTSLDEAVLENTLQQVVKYWRPETRLYDVKSLTGIWRLRGGCSQRNFESARAMFLTSNSAVVRASNQFFGENPNGFQVPVCALDSQIATVAWLKRPTAAPDLPRRQIVADCLAALEPGDALWQRFLQVVEELRDDGGVTELDYATLRYTLDARRALMTETFGSEEALTIASIPEILRRAKEAQQEELTSQLLAATEQRRLADAARTDAEKAVVAERVAGKKAAAQHQGELAKQAAALERGIGNLSHRWARRISRTGYWLVTALLATAAILASPWATGLALGGGIAALAILVVWLLAGGLLLIHAVEGKSVAALANRLERFLEVRIEKWLARSLRSS